MGVVLAWGQQAPALTGAEVVDANGNSEIVIAVRWWVSAESLPGLGHSLDDETMVRLIDLWIRERALKSRGNL